MNILHIKFLSINLIHLHVYYKKWRIKINLKILNFNVLNIDKHKRWSFKCTSCGKIVYREGEEDLLLCKDCDEKIIRNWMERLKIK